MLLVHSVLLPRLLFQIQAHAVRMFTVQTKEKQISK